MLVLAACGGAAEDTGATSSSTALSTSTSGGPAGVGCADVVDVVVAAEDGGTFRFDVTVRSPDTGWEKYADAWEVRTADGAVLGTRVLTHPHVNEQPFTRSLTGVVVPTGVTRLVVAARDLVEGFCGTTMIVSVPHRLG